MLNYNGWYNADEDKKYQSNDLIGETILDKYEKIDKHNEPILDIYQTLTHQSLNCFIFFDITTARKSSMKLWLCYLPFFILFTGFFIEPVSCIETEALSADTATFYSEYCSSVVPEATPNYRYYPTYKSFGPFQEYETGYYHSGSGNRILNSNITRLLNSFSFHTRLVYATDRDGVFKIESSLVFQSPYYMGDMAYSSALSSRFPLSLRLQGFWSEPSGKLCMFGRGSAYSKEGKLLTPAAVLKLNNVRNFNSITTLITGTLLSVSLSNSKDYFEPVSLLMIPQSSYNYTVVSEEFVDGFSGESDDLQGLPYNAQPRRSFCSIISTSGNVLNLQYTNSCNLGKDCLPFGVVGYMPPAMSLRRLELCSELKRKVRLLIEFHDTDYVGFYRPFNPNSTLIGEGFWDDKKNRLCVFVCRILDVAESWSNARVGDCTKRLTLRFPSIISLRKTSSMVGQMWTNKTMNDSGYFNAIVFESNDNRVEWAAGLKYEYTEMERVEKSCPGKKPDRNKGERYPTADNFIDMKFDMSLKSSEGKTGWGYAVPLCVGDRLYNQYSNPMVAPSSSWPVRTALSGPVNVSYEIRITLRLAPKVDGGVALYNLTREKVKINAEGTYDADTGALCMVGCRKIGSKHQVARNASMDCGILLNFQLPPLKPNKSGGYLKGSIESTRQKSDSLYFSPLTVSPAAYSAEQARQSIRTMDLEIIMVLISNTLVCVFVGLQLFHVKKNPEVLPFISLVTLVILTLGYMIPLVLNFEAMFSKKQGQNSILVHTEGALEVKEAIVRIITMVAFLLQLRLLQLALSARSGDENQRGLWFAEKMTLLLTLSIYVVGAFVTMLGNWGKHKHSHQVVLLSSHTAQYGQYSTWKSLKSYAGLISDGFLLPQILLNIFSDSRENTLTSSFYIGTSFIRLLPHVYDLYNNHGCVQLKETYIFVNPSEDFFSTAWDVCISLGVLLFAAIIYLQQRFGGRCMLPGRFRELKAYEKVPVVVES